MVILGHNLGNSQVSVYRTIGPTLVFLTYFIITVGKHTPCLLSFVYTSYIRYGVRAVPKFGKHALLFSYHKDKNYVLVITCSVILLSLLVICVCLKTFVDFKNTSKLYYSRSVLSKQKKSTETSNSSTIVNVCCI